MTKKTPFENYEKLLEKLELLCKNIHNTYSRHMNCRDKCCSCCVSGLSLLPVEKDYIILGSMGKKIVPNRKKGECIFLHEGSCQIYEHRPVVCRTQGYPLLYSDDKNKEAQISCCSLNFQNTEKDFSFSGSSVIDMDRTNMVLSAVNDKYSLESSQDRMQRTSMEKIAEMLCPAKIS